jgi:hypothetical protein
MAIVALLYAFLDGGLIPVQGATALKSPRLTTDGSLIPKKEIITHNF